jgi:sigma-B regulation protein RsbU (phosphoserine phosphatase)
MPYRHLFRLVERKLAELPSYGEALQALRCSAEVILQEVREPLSLMGARIYQRQGNRYLLEATLGDVKKIEPGFTIPESYPPIAQTLENGVSVMDAGSPGVDPRLEARLGVDKFAAISVADGQFIVAFSFAQGKNTEEIYQGLNILRQAVNAKLKEDQFNKLLSEAKKIQESILPQKQPVFQGFDIFGISHPAETVGGDYYDYIWVGNSILGLAIADATGHGLPAALQVRDVYMGLRMGSTREFKISQTFEKLNRIINREKMTSRFVSLFYGELESNGVLIYINAGHNPPIVFRRKRIEQLTEGGPVLGPLPDRHYNRGVTQLEPGNILVLYTDGILEAKNGAEEEFGMGRIISLVRQNSRASAKTIATRLIQAVRQFHEDLPQQDDMTLVVVKYLKPGPEPSFASPPPKA